MLNMFKFDCPEVVTVEDNSTSDRIACVGRCHSGPVNDSPKARREAARHDSDPPAAFLVICPCCDRQSPLCMKKVDATPEWGLIGSGFGKCHATGNRVRIGDLVIIPLNQGT